MAADTGAVGDLLARACPSLSAAVRPALAALVLAGLLGLPVPAALAASDGAAPADAGCATPLLAAPRRAAAVEENAPAKFDRAVDRNERRGVDLESLTDDRALWLDRCGAAYYVEAADPQRTEPAQAASAATSVPAGVDPFALESRPGSARTIYLDFDGETVTGTGWNKSNGIASITAEPFSKDTTVSTDFSATERDAIYQAWLVVSEDYAPFDVNVTTKDPGTAAIDRTDASDTTFGTRVLITNGGPLFDKCGCGGQAYLDVFDVTGSSHAYYQPAWVYADGLSKNGWNIGQASSHEAGHNFGLDHDATSTSGYYSGSGLWAPIMGASYGRTLSQWSRGEYAGADNAEDDVAIIAAKAPLVGDDHGDNAAAATPLGVDRPVDGLIGTRTDVDAFAFTAGGPTTLTVASPTDDTDLDLEVRILDATGALVATVNPATAGTDPAHPVPAGLGASWTVTLPETLAGYTALVDGVGNGNPLDAGSYSDYGSLGRYRVSLSTSTTGPAPVEPPVEPVVEPPAVPVTSPPPLALSTGSLPRARVGVKYKERVTLAHATPGVTWKVRGTLPKGLKLKPSRDGIRAALVGEPTRKGSYTFTVKVRDLSGHVAKRSYTVTVRKR